LVKRQLGLIGSREGEVDHVVTFGDFGAGLCCSISTIAQGDPVAIGPQDVILTRQRAEQMSPRELEAFLLRDFPHGDIRTVEVGRSMEGFPEMPLSHVVFHEAGMAAGGRFVPHAGSSFISTRSTGRYRKTRPSRQRMRLGAVLL
jgi:hypothetical protein